MRNYKILEVSGDGDIFCFDENDNNKFIIQLNLTNRYHKYYLIGINDFGINLKFTRK